jgi:hypothetical protein
MHKEHTKNTILYDWKNEKIIDIEENLEYYHFALKSKDYNLYRNIWLIPFLEKNDWDNMNEQIEKNTWKS